MLAFIGENKRLLNIHEQLLLKMFSKFDEQFSKFLNLFKNIEINIPFS